MTIKVTVGNRKVTLHDLALVAFGQAEVVLDPTIFSRLSSMKEKKGTIPPLPSYSSTEETFLCKELTRALIFTKIVDIMQQRSGIRKEIIKCLCDLLNFNILPKLKYGETKDYDLSCLGLILCMKGEGMCQLNNDQEKPIHDFVNTHHINIPSEFTPLEVATFCQGSSTSKAIACLSVYGSSGLLNLSDAIGAMSCEVNKINMKPFDAEQHEIARPHRGQVTVANTLRMFLEHSKLINTNVSKSMISPSLRCIPQYHGPIRESIETASKVLNIELNSTEIGPFDLNATSSGPFHGQPIATALANIGNGLTVLLSTSQQRKTLTLSDIEEIEHDMNNLNLKDIHVSQDGNINPMVALNIYQLIQRVQETLIEELETCLQQYAKEEEIHKQKIRKKKEQQEIHTAKHANANQASAADPSLEGLSEAKRKKIEEKRAKKAAKAAAEKAAKGSKDDFRIGNGSQAMRQFILTQLETKSIKDLVNPFDTTSDSFLTFITELIQRLGTGGNRRKPKIAKGAQDFTPKQMRIRERIFNKIRSIFKRHGGVEIETPVFELKETLTGKYGEDSKLIYDLADQGGELLALRYDLTVPFARYMALHAPGNIKRYHIARVYRRDNPQMARGRFREFYQCDFDIAGSYDCMLPDAEVLSVGIEILKSFPEIGPFQIKLSHRRLLDAILAICGVPSEKFRTTCSAIDKLDKEPWENVRLEMVEEKGIPSEVADRIQPFVCHKGHPKELHAKLTSENIFGTNPDAAIAMKELNLLFNYCEAMGILDYISFDLSLARGLDYYTGLIYEFILTSPNNVGSIAAGGRYDNLVGIFSVGGQQIPCVGVSIGIERIFGLLQAHADKQGQLKQSTCQVLIASASDNMLLTRLSLCRTLWDANISSQIMPIENPKLSKQLHFALQSDIPFMVIIGEDELAKGEVTIKKIETKEEKRIQRDDLISELLNLGCLTTDTLEL